MECTAMGWLLGGTLTATMGALLVPMIILLWRDVLRKDKP